MKIFEVTDIAQDPRDSDLGFDLVDDTSVWMRNDPQFYRKELFPAMTKIADMHRSGKSIDRQKCLGDLVEKGINRYCAKYDLGSSPEQVFTQTNRESLIDKIFGECMDEIKQGDYK
jgi:hypothetical protein|tara:strand:- start:416 stop:763 length:348 start_codon:yes stop_codon:yes gene_type:complete